MTMHKIMITNDDGIDSPGIRAAVESVLDLGEITVVAPTTQQTGTGRGLTGDKHASLSSYDYTVKGVRVRAFHCDCSPALLVRHGLRAVFSEEKPGLVISGINYGENLGSSITCSGTVGAALEAASAGIPSIAVSKQTDVESHRNYTEQDWSATMFFLNRFSKLLLTRETGHDVEVLKIDVPDSATEKTEWKITSLAKSAYYHRKIANISETSPFNAGEIVVNYNEKEISQDSDIYALAVERVVSVTPLSNDLTARVDLQDLYCGFAGSF